MCVNLFSFLGLNISDDFLEIELKKIKNGQSSNQSHMKNIQNEINEKEILIHDESMKNVEINSNIFPKINLLNSNNFTRDSGFSQIVKPLHPLKSLLYLKLLCVHPCLVISSKEHPAYHEHLKVRTKIFFFYIFFYNLFLFSICNYKIFSKKIDTKTNE